MKKATMLDFVKAMSDPQRLKIIGALSRAPLSISSLADALGIPLREMVNHVAFLEYVGILVTKAADKKQDEVCELDRVYLDRLARQHLEANREDFIPSADASEQTRRTLTKYLNPDGAIRRIPNSRTQAEQFRTILNYLADSFETGREYSEKEINTILKRFNEDVSGLRRDLVEVGLLCRLRDGSRYWKPL